MDRKSGSSTAAVTAAEVQEALGRGTVVSSEEEKGLRMRYGAKVDLGAPLARAAGGNRELEDELLVIEMQLMKAWKARLMPRAMPARSPAKDKIVRALRKKR